MKVVQNGDVTVDVVGGGDWTDGRFLGRCQRPPSGHTTGLTLLPIYNYSINQVQYNQVEVKGRGGGGSCVNNN